MKHQADRNRRERVFAVGDQVFLCLQPYIQTLIAPRANHKLSFKFFGPFDIVERIVEVAYKLALPPASKVHPVSCLPAEVLHWPRYPGVHSIASC
jgi:hypothetical protein